MKREQFEMELLAGIQEQFYEGELNYAGLALIGLMELEGENLKRIIDEEDLQEAGE